MRKTLLGFAAAFLVYMADAAPGFAGTTGVLVGRIVDGQSGAPIVGARIGVVSPSQSASATSDASGSYRFLSLAPDSYVLSVTQEGYEPVTESGITVLADQTRNVNVTLVKQLRTIGQVRARAATDLIKPGTTSDVYSVSGATAEAANALSGAGSLGNSYSAIASVPGTVVQQGQQGWFQQISIRGGDIDQVGYELDGIPVNRAYDNAPETLLSSLGQQELQVYTGGTPATSDGQGLSGYVNQVIKTGTYPGFSTLVGAIGAPTFYHRLSFEIGGSSPNRLFSYYLGTAGQNQDFRYVDNSNGAGDPRYAYPLYWPEGEYNIYDGTPGGPVQFSPGQTYAIASASTRDTVANIHIGIPHHNDANKDDLQFLWLTSEFFNSYYSSVNDQGGPTAVSLAVGGKGNAYWHDGYVYDGPLYAPPQSADVVPYLFMSSPPSRSLFAPLSNDARDTNDNGVAVLKAQYQRNINARSFARVFGYSVYSNWFITGEANQNFTNYYGAELNDYEIPSHTYGVSGMYSNQLSDKHLLTLSGTYNLTTLQRRYYYAFPGNQSLSTAFTNLILPSTASKTGQCYGLAGASSSSSGTPGYVSCFASSVRGTFTTPEPFDPSAFSWPGGVTPQWIATENGPLGRVNNVSPIESAGSIQDNYRPTDRLTFNVGLRLENYLDRLANTSGANPINRAFWVAAYNNEYCYKPGVFGATNVAEAGATPTAQGRFNTPQNCTALAGTGFVPVHFVNPTGNSNISSTVIQPRIAGTYQASTDTVFRASFGVYSRPVNSSWLQYNDLNDRDFMLYAGNNFVGYGFNSPNHQLSPDTSYNYDVSWEQHLKGTDVSFKMTPFYRSTRNQLQAFPIGVGGIVSGFNVGQQRSYGVEFAARKGDYSRDGVSAQLSYTYTNSRIKYSTFPSGTSVIDSINEYIQEYNSYTAACVTISAANSRLCGLPAGAKNPNSAPSFASSNGGTVKNPYYSQPVQALFDPTGEYTTYDQIPQVFVGSNGYETPDVLALILNYKRGPFNATPSLTFSSGSNYGSPLAYPGYYPNGGCQVANGQPIPYTCEHHSSPISGQSFLLIPDAFTGKFDGLGAFQEPSRLTLNMAFGYQPTPHVKITLTLAGLIDQCYQRGYAWDDPNICVYSELPSGGAAVGPSGNFLPLNKTPIPLRYPYGPFNDNLNTGFSGVKIPLEGVLDVQFRL